MSKIITERVNTEHFQGKVTYPKQRLGFNNWIDKVWSDVERQNEERHGINRPSTIKA